jgi:hypothetical protein
MFYNIFSSSALTILGETPMSNRPNPIMSGLLGRVTKQRTIIFSLLLMGALIAFEIFNYSTTDFAMSDLLGDLRFAGMRWATILAVAFCGIDFAGIARLFTPESGSDEPNEVWYLFGAWLLAATMNATLTWWGVSIAILQHQSLGNAVISRDALLKAVPIFVALMVWLSRVLIIGTFSVAGEKLFNVEFQNYQTYEKSTLSKSNKPASRPSTKPMPRSTVRRIPTRSTVNRPAISNSFSPKPKPIQYKEYSHPPINQESNNDVPPRSFS